MPERMTCPHGHEWEADETADVLLLCPVCGATPAGSARAFDTEVYLPARPGRLPMPAPGPALVVPRPDEPLAVPGDEILGPLARGGMGLVDKARHLILDRVVALKLVPAGQPPLPITVARFRAEARAVAALHHPTIVATRTRLHSTGMPLGVVPEGDFAPEPATRLEPGEVVVLLTDGVVEVESPAGESFGHPRVLDVVRAHRGESAREIVEARCGARLRQRRPAARRHHAGRYQVRTRGVGAGPGLADRIGSWHRPGLWKECAP
jgi:hypothetical protein